MAELYYEGYTLEEISHNYELTRERVRQILKMKGVSRFDGGSFLRSKKKQEELELLRNQKCLEDYGCSYEDYVKHIRGYVSELYNRQKTNARSREIEWKLTKWEWFTIWNDSGHFSERGRGHDKYVMSRIGDKGVYEVGNVEIKLADDNNREYMERRWSVEKADFI